ncbi:NADH:ubiquinone reductase (Na(+)-transporting) subunit E, partial [bacterium]|nr:NADH:ubiquinone reductase (Na(+)-transporting) subunit E [bacterium]
MSETPVLVILIAAIFTNNILLSSFLGMCSFLACSKQIDTAVGLGIAVTFVTTCTTALNHVIYYEVLVEGAPLCSADLTHLSFIIFIAVIAA